MDVSLAAAFAAGIISFISPCVLPLVPPYLCYIAGITYGDLVEENRTVHRMVLIRSLAFVSGFGLVFIGLGAIATTFGRLVSENAQILSVIAGCLIILFGLHFLGIFRIPFLYRQFRFDGPAGSAKGGLFGAFALGLAFAFGWTPCVGPILASILFMAGGEESLADGILLLGAYAAGIGLPFVLAAAFVSRFLAISGKLRKHMGTVEKVVGALLVLTGILFLTGGINEIGFWLQENIPAFSELG